MSDKSIIDKLGITPGYKREDGDNLIRHGVKYSATKHRYSLKEMLISDAAPAMLEALIGVEKVLTEHDIEDCSEIRSLIESATGKSWSWIKAL